MKLTKRFISKYNKKTKIIYDNLIATSDGFDDVLMEALDMRCTDRKIKKLYRLSDNLLMNAIKEEN